ncbi:MAG TPA: hypothetical protein DDZ51_08920, partial [Planctomycetaceae bacterium]|nr:hypothetical protein [Planctomycetaceae bacterium]
QRETLGKFLHPTRSGIEADSTELRWWTFAGGRINSTLRYALTAIEPTWTVIPDNCAVKVRGASDSLASRKHRSPVTRGFLDRQNPLVHHPRQSPQLPPRQVPTAHARLGRTRNRRETFVGYTRHTGMVVRIAVNQNKHQPIFLIFDYRQSTLARLIRYELLSEEFFPSRFGGGGNASSEQNPSVCQER